MACSSLCAHSLQESSRADVLEDQLWVSQGMTTTKVGQNYEKATFFPSSSLHSSHSVLLPESGANPSAGSFQSMELGKIGQGRITQPIPCAFLLARATRKMPPATIWFQVRRPFYIHILREGGDSALWGGTVAKAVGGCASSCRNNDPLQGGLVVMTVLPLLSSSGNSSHGLRHTSLQKTGVTAD